MTAPTQDEMLAWLDRQVFMDKAEDRLRIAIRTHIVAQQEEIERLKLPEGWVAVPREPTEEMIHSARKHHEGEPYLPISLYKAMLAAAPKLKE